MHNWDLNRALAFRRDQFRLSVKTVQEKQLGCFESDRSLRFQAIESICNFQIKGIWTSSCGEQVSVNLQLSGRGDLTCGCEWLS